MEKSYVVTIEKIISSGVGLARIDGKVCFVPDVLPQEAAEILIVKEKRDFFEGRVVKILKSSPHRVAPQCNHYTSCGGCNAQHMNYQYQLEIKRAILKEILERTARLSPECIDLLEPEVEPSQPWEYRNRTQLHGSQTGNYKGFYQRGSNRITSIEHCPVLVPVLQSFLTAWNPKKEETLQLYGTDRVYQQEECVEVVVAGRPMSFGANLFFQSNLIGVNSLIKWVYSVVTPGNRCADLYGGVGLFGAVLSHLFREVVVIERDSRVLPFVQKNLPEGEVYTESVEEWFRKNGATRDDLKGNPLDRGLAKGAWKEGRQAQKSQQPSSNQQQVPYDLVVVDPPRVGLSAATKRGVISLEAREILYISCNPVTQARDIRFFLDNGYELKAFRGFDFYPQTFHIESAALLVRM